MYQLYTHPDACSLATHTLLNLLDVPFTLHFRDNVQDFTEINPTNMVPVLQQDHLFMKEGAAIILSLLSTHNNNLLPASGLVRQQRIEQLMFANATMHPAYGRLFFASAHLQGEVLQLFLNAVADDINLNWQQIESQLVNGHFLGGDSMSAADILLAVYSRWGQHFPVDIIIGPRSKKMIELVINSAPFQLALKQQEESKQRHEK